ncbi:OmpH family outer membrane protein [Nubsella zeaxanthinifaciens]|uniref:OmpH family outer membrane protein n=1 Tax=Nubsella zeaxanthinifaciens TaxID=392412 RepID=UPI000DE514F4|nr:OmpH family outer membrane protein [Nubsella zeaxanthinifaciens]
MKTTNIKKIKSLIILIAFFSLPGFAKAQLAIINSQKVLASMKEFAKIDTLVAKETATYQIDYNKKQQALNQLIVTADSLNKIDQKSEATTKAITKAQTADKELKSYAEQANKKIADYKQLLSKPYTDRVMTAIKTVAARGKFMQVLDSSSANLLYINPLSDITDQVIKELKMK